MESFIALARKLGISIMCSAAACATDATTTSAVTACERDAAAVCERIGYGDNAYCAMSLSADCSPEDAEIAYSTCLGVNPKVTRGEPCELPWR